MSIMRILMNFLVLITWIFAINDLALQQKRNYKLDKFRPFTRIKTEKQLIKIP